VTRKTAATDWSSGPSEAEAGGVLTIDLDALAANWRSLAERAGSAECAAVVKADAYGCGIDPAASALSRAGCATFFVAHLDEARSVRRQAPGAIIYVLNGLMPDTALSFSDNNLRPVLCSRDELSEWQAYCAGSGWSGGAALHVDTGMNRLGLSLAEAAAAAANRPRLSLLMSHLACSEDPTHALNARQMGLFRELRDLFPGVPGSLANSSGIFLGPDAQHDLVRPGVALYGANPTPAHLNPMRPVVTLQGRVLQVRTAEAGETVGYGATWTARRQSRLAIVSIGYADGLPRAASGADNKTGADAIINGHRCPFAGRISMDLLAIDVTDLGGKVARGDMASLLGEALDVDELAAHAGTVAYEILTLLGRRYARRYRGVGLPAA
jgi:alanine racemase